MGFDVAAEAYARFMGRYSEPLAVSFLEVAGLEPGQRALDVGCGPGALTARLVDLLGPDHVAAIDPSESFVSAARERFPAVDVRLGYAEELPFAADAFDAALAELVVHFMSDPVAGLREMARVTRPGGVVAACVWDMSSDANPLATFWAAVRESDPAALDESGLPGVREGDLVALATAAGLVGVSPSQLWVGTRYESFDEWWEPYTLGVGPAGGHVAGLAEEERRALRERCARRLGDGPFDVVARAWCVRGSVT